MLPQEPWPMKEAAKDSRRQIRQVNANMLDGATMLMTVVFLARAHPIHKNKPLSHFIMAFWSSLIECYQLSLTI